MREEKLRRSRPRDASGFALILAILALMLLTFLGLTLAATTSTELQIATNYRWSQQAFYNAEAGLEAGKVILRLANWGQILPAPRHPNAPVPVAAWTPSSLPAPPGSYAAPTAPTGGAAADQWGNAVRQYESTGCDRLGNGAGYGVVLDDRTASAPYQYVTTLAALAPGQVLNGAFTLWVRRPLVMDAATGLYQDYWKNEDDNNDGQPDGNDTLVLTSEGVAPYTGGTITQAFGVANRAVRVLEQTVSRNLVENPGGCPWLNSGQAGSGQEGAGFGGCAPLGNDPAGLAAARGRAAAGTGGGQGGGGGGDQSGLK